MQLAVKKQTLSEKITELKIGEQNFLHTFNFLKEPCNIIVKFSLTI